MSLTGMDIEAARALARQFDDAAGQLETLSSTLSVSLSSIEWVGPDADTARANWEGHHGPLLAAAGTRLRDGAQALYEQIAEQVAASEAGASAPGAPVPVPGPQALGLPPAPAPPEPQQRGGISSTLGHTALVSAVGSSQEPYIPRVVDAWPRAVKADLNNPVKMGLAVAGYAVQGTDGARRYVIGEWRKIAQESLEESNRLFALSGQSYDHRFHGTRAQQLWETSSHASLQAGKYARLGRSFPVIGVGLTAAGIAYDVGVEKKPAGKAVISGVGSAGLSVGGAMLAGAAAGSVLGPVGSVAVGAIAGLTVGIAASGLLDSMYDNAPQGVRDGIEEGFKAVSDSAGDVVDGVKDVWDSIF